MTNISKKNILITGGAGAIGSNLVHRLAQKNTLIVLDDMSSGNKRWIQGLPSVTVLEGDIANDDDLERAFSLYPIQYVFHLAAHFANQNSIDHPRDDLQTNGLGTLKLLEYAQKAKVEQFLYASSSCIYGQEAQHSPTEEGSGDLETPYAITKLLGEQYTTYFHEYYKLPAVIIRIFNCYGPHEIAGRYRNVIPIFFDLAAQKKPLPIYGTGKETRCFTYVEDLLDGMLAAMTTSDAVGQIINLGSETPTAVLDIAERINKLMNNLAGVRFLGRRPWDRVTERIANIKKAKALFGYQPRVDVDAGLKRYSDWYQGYLKNGGTT